ncbi:MAG: hypothetical protein ABI553_01635 [Chloroflexota bacterium]
MRRFSAAIIAGLLAAGLLAPVSFAATGKPASTTVPRVVFIVGPAGAATDGYRAEARAAATIARRYTPDVVELYSPDATWQAVRQALDGASLVVYMGHGNGWPSHYRDALYPPSQDGFGLNPAAGGGDSSHQYFGEASIAAQVKLAKNAVVLLNHLCYASGNAEPGLPEGTLDQARQRVDNYAAGFITAGASAVIAEAWSSPSYFVRAILGGGRSIQGAWQDSPSANAQRIAFASTRSPGYVAQMDPETASTGFTRSIVMKAGLAPTDVLAGAAGSAGAPAAAIVPAQPTLVGSGLELGAPDIHQLPSAGTAGHVDLLFKIKDRKQLPAGLQASARWDPIDLAVLPADSTPRGGPAAPSGASSPDASPTSDLSDPTTTVIEAPDENVDLVVPERVGDVVAPVAVKFGKTAMVVPVTMPKVPGRYRLTITLHDADGVEFDAPTQALTPPLMVRVTGEYDGALVAAPQTRVAAGADLRLGVRAVNLGVAAWGQRATASAADYPSHGAIDEPAHVVGRWIPLSLDGLLSGPDSVAIASDLPIGLAPGNSADAVLATTAPTVPGQYLLLLDIVTPEHGSLVASGAEPTLVRVTVLAAP